MTRRLVLAFALLLSLPLVASAQTSLRFYIVPEFRDPILLARVPKYIGASDAPIAQWQARDYGLDQVFAVGAFVTAAQHTAIASNIDVIAIPAQLDSAIGLVALSTVQDRLESLRVPAGWVTAQHTYRDVLRVTLRIFNFMGRFHAREGRTFFESGITLETRMNQLTAGQRAALTSAADSFGLDTSAVTNTSTVRQVLKLIADEMPAVTIFNEVF